MILIYCLLVNVVVKLSVLGITEGTEISLKLVGDAVLSSVLEHIVFVSTVVFIQWKWLTPSMSASSHSKFVRKVYLSLALPDISKLVAIALQTWDPGQNLLFSIGLLVTSIQYNAFSTVIHHSFPDSNTL